MKKTVEFEIKNVKSSEAWTASSYQHDGFYLVTDEFNNSSFVQVINNVAFGAPLMSGTYPETKDVSTVLIDEKQSINPDNVSGDILLKAIAIVQNPELAKDLLK